MTRTQRVQRIAGLVERRERQSRQALASANLELHRAEAALESVFEQCSRVTNDCDDLPLAFGRALIEAGWLTAEDREVQRTSALGEADAKRAAWQHQHTRLDALGRLVDRLATTDDAQQRSRLESELDDLLQSRNHTAAQHPAASVELGS